MDKTTNTMSLGWFTTNSATNNATMDLSKPVVTPNEDRSGVLIDAPRMIPGERYLFPFHGDLMEAVVDSDGTLSVYRRYRLLSKLRTGLWLTHGTLRRWR